MLRMILFADLHPIQEVHRQADTDIKIMITQRYTESSDSGQGRSESRSFKMQISSQSRIFPTP